MNRLLALLALVAGPACAADLPPGVTRLLPPGFKVLATATASFGAPATVFHIVALARPGDGDDRNLSPDAPARPLLLFRRLPDGSFRLAGRNDVVVMRANEGGQCDPFLDEGAVIAVKGSRFTVQNGVACGQHWTDYVTFRFDDAHGGYVFDNERSESWSLNPSRDPNAEAVIRDGPPRIRRADPAHPVPFSQWRWPR